MTSREGGTSPQPTGRLEAGAAGLDLVLTRTFRAPIGDVWASLTESERTARWFGSWSGEAGPGRTITVTMVHEEGAPSAEVQITACEPPRHLALRTPEAWGAWRFEAHLTERAGVTELRFTHHLDEGVDVGSVGPGWEYYLDNLQAAHEGRAAGKFTDYYPAQQEYYRAAQAAAVR